MSDNLVDFLRARLDEDERIAKQAGERSTKWRLATHPDDEELSTTNWLRFVELMHAERHDPARVLAEVDAKRRMMEIHNAVNSWGMCMGCPRDESNSFIICIAECPILRALALPYADHPDYRSEWRPS